MRSRGWGGRGEKGGRLGEGVDGKGKAVRQIGTGAWGDGSKGEGG